MLKLKLQYFWSPDAKSWLIRKDLMLVKTKSTRRSGWQRMRWLNSIADSMDMNLSKLWETAEDRGAWRAAVRQQRGMEMSWTWLSNWTTIGVIRTHPHTPAAGGLSAHVPRFYMSNIWAQRTGCNSDPSNMEVCQWGQGTISHLLCVCVRHPLQLTRPFHMVLSCRLLNGPWRSRVGPWGPDMVSDQLEISQDRARRSRSIVLLRFALNSGSTHDWIADDYDWLIFYYSLALCQILLCYLTSSA